MKMRGFMKRFIAILAVLCLITTAVTAQTSEESETPDFVYEPNQQGDQFVRLNLALELPVYPTQLRLGGTGTLSYGMFLTENFNLSAKVSFAYTTTIGSNMFYFIPFTFCAQYQMLFKNFEIPVSLEIGGAIESYIDRLFFGLAIKPEGGIFYRVSPDWSIGMYAGLFVLPQWYEDSQYNYIGVISDMGVSVRYHF